ncbi:MAG: hypothetical protein EBU49_11000, partial [Proteobacteria bacterium]|nr:hypothetical protein [Pseudomonadota bacterium]
MAAETHPLESIAQVIAFTAQDEALKGFTVALSALDESGFIHIKNESLHILALPPEIWTKPNLLKKVTNPGPSTGTVVLMLTNKTSTMNNLNDVLATQGAIPQWMAEAPVQTATLPTTGAVWRSTINNILQLHKFFLKSDKIGDDLRSDSENIKSVMSISRELNGERDIPKLLNLILL